MPDLTYTAGQSCSEILAMPKPFDLFAEFAKFGAQERISLRDPNATSAFIAHAQEAVNRALADPIFLHGQRAEAMFEAMLVSLGDYSLLKPEDVGRIYPDDRFSVPDYRVVLKSGEQWLIEVKNVYVDDPALAQQERQIMARAYREKLEAYAAATGGKLKLAVFWARWGIWTLISPGKLLDANGDLTLNLPRAMMANELSALGDRTIGTRPPLRIRLLADPEKTSPVAPDGTVNVTIGDAKVFCGESEILDPAEKEIAWTSSRALGRFGRCASAGADTIDIQENKLQLRPKRPKYLQSLRAFARLN